MKKFNSTEYKTDIIGKYIVRFISESDNYEDINSMLIKTINKLGLSWFVKWFPTYWKCYIRIPKRENANSCWWWR